MVFSIIGSAYVCICSPASYLLMTQGSESTCLYRNIENDRKASRTCKYFESISPPILQGIKKKTITLDQNIFQINIDIFPTSNTFSDQQRKTNIDKYSCCVFRVFILRNVIFLILFLKLDYSKQVIFFQQLSSIFNFERKPAKHQ